MYCSKEEVRDEVRAQLEAGLRTPASTCSRRRILVAWFLDPRSSIPTRHRRRPRAAEINTAGSWEDHPEAVTEIENLFLASDYVRTRTDLKTMEGANEAARRAVNGILDTTGSTQPHSQCGTQRAGDVRSGARVRPPSVAARRPPQQQIRVVEGRIEASAVASVGALRCRAGLKYRR